MPVKSRNIGNSWLNSLSAKEKGIQNLINSSVSFVIVQFLISSSSTLKKRLWTKAGRKICPLKEKIVFANFKKSRTDLHEQILVLRGKLPVVFLIFQKKFVFILIGMTNVLS